MTKFNVGDKVKHPDMDELYEVIEIDETSNIIPKYKVNRIKDNLKEFWDYCVDWIKIIDSDDALRYGKTLTDDMFEKRIADDSGWDLIRVNYIRIRTILYDNRIFYHKMMNGEVIEFKELTV